MKKSMRIVLAFGGNAITGPDGRADLPTQLAQTARTVKPLADLIQQGHQLIITHGNGPQVGNALLRVELAADEVITLPLEMCVAHTQGGMGYMIAQCMTNELIRRGLNASVTGVVTSVRVDRDDPAFEHPTKPIGPFYSEAEAERHRCEDGWQIREISEGRYRRIVASPKPVEILERDAIKQLVEANKLVIACGGGGIPVVRNARGECTGVPAVVDKDFSSALLAADMNADCLVILTAVEKVCVDFEKPTQRQLDRLTVAEARQFLDDGQFPAGSMGPKVGASIQFLQDSNKADAFVVICDARNMLAALEGRGGTRMTRT